MKESYASPEFSISVSQLHQAQNECQRERAERCKLERLQMQHKQVNVPHWHHLVVEALIMLLIQITVNKCGRIPKWKDNWILFRFCFSMFWRGNRKGGHLIPLLARPMAR